MSIKNDKWIIEQSTPPKFVVTEEILSTPVGTLITAADLNLRTVEHLSHLSEVQIRAAIDRRHSNMQSFAGLGDNPFAGGIVSYRGATNKDLEAWRAMIEPFVPEQTRYRIKKEFLEILAPEGGYKIGEPAPLVQPHHTERLISYGVSSFGYDVRIARQFKIFTNINSTVVDPKSFDDRSFVDFEGDVCIIPPNSFVLASSLEYFRMPRNVSGLVIGKSTYARCGVNCLATPLEPGWEGHITLEFANTTPLPAKLYANEGAAQVQFFEGEQPLVSYADRGGKYQGQRGITLPRA